MDYDKEIAFLAAEVLATRAVLTNVLIQIRKDPQNLQTAIKRGFDEATDLIARGRSVRAVTALHIIDDMRATALRD